MANKLSAKKRIRQNKKRWERNRIYRGRARTHIKNVRAAIEEKNLDLARTEAEKAVKSLDKAAVKGILHKNNVARRKGRIMKQLAHLEAEIKS